MAEMNNKKHEGVENKAYESAEAASEYIDVPVDIKSLSDKFMRIKQRYSQRDSTMSQIQHIREGRMSDIAPDIFPEMGAWQEPIVANMIDIAARDMAEMIAPLPTLTCNSSTMVNTREYKKAIDKTKIALGYVTASDLQVQMYSAADWYVSYGILPFRVELDYERSMPVIRTLNPIGSYPELDRYGRVVSFYQRTLVDRDELAAQFPEYANKLKNKNGIFGSREIEVIFYHDKNWDLAFVGGTEPFILDKTPNKLGKVMIRIAQRPGATDIPRGQFDDVIFLQLARAAFALLQLEAANESVKAPLVVPDDVMEIPYGPGATIRTKNPQGVGRVPIEIPQSAFAEQQALEHELQLGSRFPQIRTGNADQSIVTGKGVQALMGGYESQIVAHQAIMSRVLQEVISLCFEVDECIFGDFEKSLRGSENGTPFEIKYNPKKTINGDYTVDVKYGLMAGLDPNRALVFGLQARAEKLISRDFLRRELPFSIDVEDEKRKVDVEDLEEAFKSAMLGYSQAIPAMAQQGQDPSHIIEQLTKVIADRRNGVSLSDSIAKVFEAPKPTKPTPEEQAAMEQQALMSGQGMPPESQGGMPTGAQAPQGPPDIATLMAGLTASGQPNLSARMTRNQTI